jgi:hypothetical protein
MADVGVERVGAVEARGRVRDGRALLVCAYEDEGKCQRLKLEGARTLREVERQMTTLPRDQEIIFYCA